MLGYVIHILTDIVYDEYFEEEIKKEILKENDEKNYWYIKWSDMDKYSFKDKKKIINILNQEDKYYEITNITEDKLRYLSNNYLSFAIDDIRRVIKEIEEE